jgi:co-chaperonin GroES (HSP10)
MIKLNYISTAEALKMANYLSNVAMPSVSKLLVFSPGENEEKLSSGLYIPSTAKEDRPRKGVIILRHPSLKQDPDMESITKEGLIITYGLYAGKEVEFDEDIFSEDLKEIVKKGKFTVLDSHEIIMAEANK